MICGEQSTCHRRANRDSRDGSSHGPVREVRSTRFTPWPFTSGRAANAIRLPVFKARTPVLEAASKAIDRVWYGAEQGRLLIPHRRKASRLARQRAAADDLNGMRWIPGRQTVPPRVLHEPRMRFGSHCSFQREYWEATSLPQPPYQA